jgi:uncharacterized protein (TIGR02452 family)
MTREQLKEQASLHHAEMLNRFSYSPTLDGWDVIYTPESKFIKYDDKNYKFPLIVSSNDTVSEVIKQAKLSASFIGVLNFASFTSPGGGFLNGAHAQEEDLCHNSDLYERISLEADFYAYNIKHKNNGAYENRAIFSYDIIFIDPDTDKEYVADVLTCAAPNKKTGSYSNVTWNNSEILRNRIQFVLNIMQAEEVQIPILGAWGCGVFGQDPREVATLFKEELTSGKYNFEKVIFAIPVGYNYDCFKEIIEK